MSKKKLEPINYKWEPKAGDRVLDRMFPEYGPATLEQHPDPGSVMDGRDKWTKSFYESAHQRDNERIEELTGLVQELVDAVALTNGADTPMLQLTAFDARNTVLSKAKQSGFTPSTQ